MQACLVEQTRPDTLVKVVQRQPRRSNEQVVDASACDLRATEDDTRTRLKMSRFLIFSEAGQRGR